MLAARSEDGVSTALQLVEDSRRLSMNLTKEIRTQQRKWSGVISQQILTPQHVSRLYIKSMKTFQQDLIYCVDTLFLKGGKWEFDILDL